MAMFSKLKQFKDLRSQAKSLQNTLSAETVHAEAKGGKIDLVMDGNQKIISLDIADELMKPERKDEVVNGLKDAFHDATKKVQRVMAEKMRASGMKIPGLDT